MGYRKSRLAPKYTTLQYIELKRRNGYRLTDEEKKLLGTFGTFGSPKHLSDGRVSKKILAALMAENP